MSVDPTNKKRPCDCSPRGPQASGQEGTGPRFAPQGLFVGRRRLRIHAEIVAVCPKAPYVN